VPLSSPADEFEDYRREVRSWLASSVPAQPDFALPQNALMVTSEEQVEWLRAWQRQLYEAGLVGTEWPAEFGGGGRAPGHQAIVDQEMTRAAAPFLVNNVALAWAGPIILNYGTDAQRTRYLKKLLSCEEIWCQGFSEPGAGSDLASLQTRAVRDGEEYVLDGHKVWTSLGQFADHMILLARTDPDVPKHAGISYFLSPMRVPGVEVRPLVKITGEGGFNQVLFDGARIPADTRVGAEGEGWTLAIATLNFERGASAGSAGSSDMGGGGFDELLALVRKRGPEVCEDPVVRDRIAQLATRLAAMRCSRQRSRVPGLVLDRPMALPLMGKLVMSEVAQEMADFACEIDGYAGTLWRGDPAAHEDALWQRSYLNSFALTIAGGTSEIVRNIVGEKVLGLPKTR
jgi:alkylation response protein AidB-like acyl-CoA dehydrogenase